MLPNSITVICYSNILAEWHILYNLASRRSERMAKMRQRSKDYYERNKEAVISEVRAEHYTLNKDCIRKNQAKYYEKCKNLVAQR